MKTIVATLASTLSPTLAAALVVTAASPALAARTCVQVRDIDSATSKDGKLMTFRMKDGRVLVNHLQGVCSDLRYEGFVWTVRGTEDICENQQSLKVLRSGQICLLGKFDLVKDKPIHN